MAKTVEPPAGMAAMAANAPLTAEEAARKAIEDSAKLELASDGVDYEGEFEFKPSADLLPSPQRIHPKANYFPEGMEPVNQRERGPKPYMTSYTERERLETVLVDQGKEQRLARETIAQARREIAGAEGSIPAAEKALAGAVGDEARSKAERLLGDLRNAVARANQTGAKAVVALKKAQDALAGANDALSPERLIEARQALRHQRWRDALPPLERAEEDRLLG